jgi:drug/metabolite transporter (DMT)-like permease
MGKKENVGQTDQWKGVFWLLTWYILNMSISIFNKLLLSHTVFKYAILLTMVHMLFNAICARLVIMLTNKRNKKWNEDDGSGNECMTKSEISQKLNHQIAIFTVIYCLNIAFGNICSKLVSLPFSTLFRSTIPIFIIPLSYLLLGTKPSKKLCLSVIPIILGVSVTTKGEVEVTLSSLIILFIGNTLCGLKSVLSNKYMKEQGSNPIILIDRLSLPSAVLLFIFAYFSGEIHSFMSNWRELTLWPLFLILVTAAMAFALNWANFLAVKYTSALTMSVSGNTKQVLIIAIGAILFNNPINILNASGCAITIAGMSWYSYIKYMEDYHKK